MSRSVSFGGGRAGGKTAKAEAALREALQRGVQALDCTNGHIARITLAADGVTIQRTAIAEADFYASERETLTPDQTRNHPAGPDQS